MDQTEQTKQTAPPGMVEETAGCMCVVCVTSRANRRQAEMITSLQASIARVRVLCDASDHYLAPGEVIDALDGPAEQVSRGERATIGGKGHGRQTFAQRPVTQVDLPADWLPTER